jgi:hypothetical protein
MYINLLIVLSVVISGFLFISVCNYFNFLNENRWKQHFMHHFNATVSIVETPLTRIVPDNNVRQYFSRIASKVKTKVIMNIDCGVVNLVQTRLASVV